METFIPLHDTDEGLAFYRDNRDAIECDEKQAYALACNQCLLIGGGAAPLFRVGFVDAE